MSRAPRFDLSILERSTPRSSPAGVRIRLAEIAPSPGASAGGELVRNPLDAGPAETSPAAAPERDRSWLGSWINRLTVLQLALTCLGLLAELPIWAWLGSAAALAAMTIDQRLQKGDLRAPRLRVGLPLPRRRPGAR